MPDSSESLPSQFTDSIPEIVERYRQGVAVTQLAKDARRSYQTIYNWMIRYAGEQYKHIKYEVAINRLADAEYERDTASTQLEYARARDKCKDYRDDLKRIAPDLYSDKVFSQTDNTITVVIQPAPPVIPPIDITPPIISVDSEVIDKTKEDQA